MLSTKLQMAQVEMGHQQVNKCNCGDSVVYSKLKSIGPRHSSHLQITQGVGCHGNMDS